MKPEALGNRPGEVRMKRFAIRQLNKQILAIQRSMREPDLNGKLPGEYDGE